MKRQNGLARLSRVQRDMTMPAYVMPLRELGAADVELVGGKNSSLGEMLRELGGLGVACPTALRRPWTRIAISCATTASRAASRRRCTVSTCRTCAALARTGAEIRRAILETPLPARLRDEAVAAWRALGGGRDIAVAVRSSATAEDLPDASFAGQQETFLNVRGERDLLAAMHEVFASLFNDRAIAYRVHQGFDHSLVGLSVGVQHMVRSDLGCERRDVHARYRLGFPRRRVHHELVRSRRDRRAGRRESGRVLRLQAGAGRREARDLAPQPRREGHQDGLRRGCRAAERVMTVDVPPEQRRRFSMTDAEIETLARQAVTIERHYGCPMDIEWAKDGSTGELFIVQARPETVQSQGRAQPAAVHAEVAFARGRRRPQHRPEDRGGPRARRRGPARDGARRAWRRAGDGHDGSGLGARDEARGRDRDAPRRPHVPRGDHRARARRARGRGLRRHA